MNTKNGKVLNVTTRLACTSLISLLLFSEAYGEENMKQELIDNKLGIQRLSEVLREAEATNDNNKIYACEDRLEELKSKRVELKEKIKQEQQGYLEKSLTIQPYYYYGQHGSKTPMEAEDTIYGSQSMNARYRG